MKKAFTIVELLMVLGIIGILLGIITTAASGAVKNSRDRRANVLCTLVQTGLATYYAQNDGKWPINISVTGRRENRELENDKDDPTKYVLSGAEVKECIYQMVMETKRNRPCMDVTGLFVSEYQGRYGQKCSGMDFTTAIRGSKAHPERMTPSKMYFGYPDKETGQFRHFKIVYSIPTDSMTVSKMDGNREKAEYYE